MIIVLRSGSLAEEIEDVCRRIRVMGYQPHTIRGELRTVIGAVGDDRGKERLRALASLSCVESVTPILQPFKLASREVKNEASRIPIADGVTVGGERLVVMAGPCSVESRAQVLEVAAKVKAAGAAVLRGGAFKPRTSPYTFQGLEEEGLKLLAEAKQETGLPIVTEVMEPTSSRSARATCRTSHSSVAWPRRGRPCSSSAACRPPSRSGSCPRSTCSPGATPT